MKELRKEHKYSIQGVSTQLGISKKELYDLEAGRHRLCADILIKLSNFYNVSIDYILCQTNFPDRYVPEIGNMKRLPAVLQRQFDMQRSKKLLIQFFDWLDKQDKETIDKTMEHGMTPEDPK